MTVPAHPKLYHIVHVDRLASILADGVIWCDAGAQQRTLSGTMIGMSRIKERPLTENRLASHPDLMVGDCVPFYFCPRSIMLYLIWRGNHLDLTYRGGQGPIVHLEVDLQRVVAWASQNRRRWAFTTSNAGSSYFEDFADLRELDRINWDAVRSNHWSGAGIDSSVKEGKQAEFLVESHVPWKLVERIGVCDQRTCTQVYDVLAGATERPKIEMLPAWYY